MSAERQIKKIDLSTLDQADHKVSLGKLRKLGVALVLILFLAGGGYGAYRLVSGEIVASRFTVNKMNCPACVITVKEVTGKLPGVVEADVSLAAQDVTVKFRSKQTNPDQIKDAIARAGYPIKLEGLFKPGGPGIDEVVVATVNGKPLFGKDVKVPFSIEKRETDPDTASAFFSVAGKEILLQAADAKFIVVQPYEVESEVEAIFKNSGKSSPEEFLAEITAKFGSKEKYFQIVGQRLGIRKLLDEHVLLDVQDPQERTRKTLEWVGMLFKDSDVKVVDPAFKEKVHAALGQDEWKTFWPRMIGARTELKSLLVQ